MIFGRKQPQIKIEPQPEQRPMETLQIENEDLQKWEMEVATMVDKKVNEMQGMIFDYNKGGWVRHPYKKAIMNELGAWEFKQEVNSRVFLNMQMSDLGEDWIRITSARAGKIFADKLADNFREWDVVPLESNFESICQQLHDIIYICLMIAKNQGMRKHREKRGVSRQLQQPLPEPGVM